MSRRPPSPPGGTAAATANGGPAPPPVTFHSPPAGPAATRRRGGELIANRDFRLLWAGESVSELGSQVSTLAVPLVAVRLLQASTLAVGVLSAASTAGFLVVGLPAGAWVDRLRRRRVMLLADLVRMLAFASVPALYALGALSMVQLLLVALAAGVCTVFFDVAYQSHLPSLVGTEHLVEGNAKLVGSSQVAQIAGPGLAGALVQAIGGVFAIAVDAGSFLASALALVRLRAPDERPREPRAARQPLRQEIAEGVRFVAFQPVLRAVALTAAWSNLFSGVMTAVEVVFLVRVVHASPAVIGLLFAAVGVGGLGGAFVASRLARSIGGVRATLLGALLGAGALLIPLTAPGPGLALFATGYAVAAFGTTVFNVNQVSFRQRLCPPGMLGRMNATMRVVAWGTMPVGALLGGALGVAIGLRPALWVAAAGESVAAGWLLASPMRRLRDFPEPAGREALHPGRVLLED